MPVDISELMPEIKAFLEDHPEFGQPDEIRAVPDWVSGKRQGFFNKEGKYFLFYLKGGEVKTVYDITGDRTMVWGEDGR